VERVEYQVVEKEVKRDLISSEIKEINYLPTNPTQLKFSTHLI